MIRIGFSDIMRPKNSNSLRTMYPDAIQLK